MTKERKTLWLITSASVLIVAAFAAKDWYYKHIGWPRAIQRRLVGGEIGSWNSLIEYKGYSHYGQGAFRWRYKVSAGTAAFAALCGSGQPSECAFSKSSVVTNNVTQFVSLNEGILTVEEDWN